MLEAVYFQPTKGVNIEVAILKGELFKDGDRTSKNVRELALKRKLMRTKAEVACLIRDRFSDEDIRAMGLEAIVVFHEEIKDSAADPDCLVVQTNHSGGGLGGCYAEDDRSWKLSDGFAFAVKVWVST